LHCPLHATLQVDTLVQSTVLSVPTSTAQVLAWRQE
jgi:hypothetical protein